MALRNILKRLKEALRMETGPRKPLAQSSTRGPNGSFTFSDVPSDVYRLRNDTYKVLRRNGSIFD